MLQLQMVAGPTMVPRGVDEAEGPNHVRHGLDGPFRSRALALNGGGCVAQYVSDEDLNGLHTVR